MAESLESVETHVARLEGEMNQVISSVGRLSDQMSKLSTQLDHVSEKSRPDVSMMAQWAGIILTVIGLVSVPVAFHFNKSINDVEHQLQRESAFMVTSMKATADALNTSRVDSLRFINERLDRLQLWREEAIKADLEELRVRRLEK